MLKSKGQLSIATTIIAAAATVLASAIGGWATADSRVNAIDTKIQVVEERENNHYIEIQKAMDDNGKKLDKIIDLHINSKVK